MNMNNVIYAGNLTADPEIKQTANGHPVCNFRVASNRKYKVGTEWKEETTFMPVDTYGKNAEACGEHLKKGSNVLVEGRIKQREWIDKNGMKRTSFEIQADRVHFIGGTGKAYRPDTAPTAGVDASDIPF